jgi:hypothetical protein
MDHDERDDELEDVSTLEADHDASVDGDAPEVSRKVRHKRRTRARSKTIAPKRLTKEELRIKDLLPLFEDPDRPQTRAECKEGPRPCPYVSCKHHLYLDVNPETGSIKLNFPDLEVWEMAETCSLDVADRGGITLEEVGEILNLTRERIRQVEVRGLLKLKMVGPGEEPLPGDPNWLPKTDDDYCN